MDKIILVFKHGDRYSEVYIDPYNWITQFRDDSRALHELIRVLEWGAETQRHVIVAPPPPIDPYK